METNNKTKALDLSWKCKTLESIQKIANKLGQNSSLTQLDIGYNRIGSEGAKVIAPVGVIKFECVNLFFRAFLFSNQFKRTI